MYVLSLMLHIRQSLPMIGNFEKYRGASVTSCQTFVRSVQHDIYTMHILLGLVNKSGRHAISRFMAIRATLTTYNRVFWMNRTRNYQEYMSLGNHSLRSFVLTSAKQYFTDGRYKSKIISIINGKGRWNSYYLLYQIIEPECDDKLTATVLNTQLLLVSVWHN
jgi:hypothetical protein